MADKTTVVTDRETLELKIERVFDAPRDLVFKAWTEPDRIAQWWGPRGWQTTNYRMDVRPGGSWHYCMRGEVNGEPMESWGLTVYEEISPPQRLVYLDHFSDAEGNKNPDMPALRITIEFADVDGKTRMTSRTVFGSAQDLDNLVGMGMLEGMRETLDRLDEYVTGAA